MEDKMIRVAHIVGKWIGGGVESVIMNYYRNIDRAKIQFDFICDSDSTNIPYDEIRDLGGSVYLVPPYQKFFQYQKELYKIFKENDYKIVHSHINVLSVFPLRIAKKVGVPIRIAHSHSTTNKKEFKKNLLKQILKPFSKTYATDYFACTEHAGKWLFGNNAFKEKKVFILNNAIDVEKFKFNEKIRNEKRKELGIHEKQLVIGNVGRFVVQKNHTFLIDIFKEIVYKNKDAVLLLLGQGPLIDDIRNKVNNLGLEKNVQFLGQQNNIEKFYQVFDVFLFPSLYEGLGMVLIEAQCAGNWCVVSNEVPEVAAVSNNVAFLNLNQSLEKWCETILKCSENKLDRKEFYVQLERYGYNIKIEAKKLENKYKEIIKNNV